MAKFRLMAAALVGLAAFQGTARADENWPFATVTCSREMNLFALRAARKWGMSAPWPEKQAAQDGLYGLNWLSANAAVKCQLPEVTITVSAQVRPNDLNKECGSWTLGQYVIDVKNSSGSASKQFTVYSGSCSDDRSRLLEISGRRVITCVVSGTENYADPLPDGGCTMEDLRRPLGLK